MVKINYEFDGFFFSFHSFFSRLASKVGQMQYIWHID